MNQVANRPRRFDGPGEAARCLLGVIRVMPDLWRAYRGGVDPAVRERVMVAVSEANACAGCSQAHQRWAVRTGVSEADLKALGLKDLGRLDPSSRAAVVYAVERSATGFPGAAGGDPGDPDVARAMSRHFDRSETVMVDAITRSISFANLSVGSVVAFRERFARPAD